MNFSGALRLFLPLIPISGLALAVQGLFALVNPYSDIGQHFIKAAPDLFIFELVLMHSNVFWLLRNSITKYKFMKIILALILVFGYSLFIIPMIKTSPYLATNYIIFCTLRLFSDQQEPWFANTEFYRIGLDKKGRSMFLAAIALVKVCLFALIFPFVGHFLPVPSGGLNFDIMKAFHPNDLELGTTFASVKGLIVYFILVVLFEMFLLWRRRAN